MASRHELRARHTEEKQKQNPQELFKRNMAVAALVGMTAAAAIGVFAKEYFLDYGDITVEATEDGNFVSYTDENEEYHEREENTDGEIIITQDSEEAVKNTLTIDVEKNRTAEVIIDGINIDTDEAAIFIQGAGDVVLELDGDNVVKSGDYHAGVETAGNGMLTIEDEDNDGSLDATGGEMGAGIGGGWNEKSTVTIAGGDIIAQGGELAAGIGGGYGASGTVAITGGKVTAVSGKDGAGIGGGSDGVKGNVTITGGEVDASGNGRGTAIGGGRWGCGTVIIAGGIVTATASSPNEDPDSIDPDIIGSGSCSTEKGENFFETTVTLKDGTITERPYGWKENGHTHAWEVSEYTAPTYEAKGVEIWLCECGSKKTEFLPALTLDEQMPNGQMLLTVTTLLSTAQPYEQTMADGRALFAAPAQDAILTGSLGALAELKAQGAITLVFRTQLCETSVSIDKILAAGSEDDVFVLTHKGTEAVLTVEGRVVE